MGNTSTETSIAKNQAVYIIDGRASVWIIGDEVLPLGKPEIACTVETEIVDTLVKASKNAFTSQINEHNLETLDQICWKG